MRHSDRLRTESDVGTNRNRQNTRLSHQRRLQAIRGANKRLDLLAVTLRTVSGPAHPTPLTRPQPGQYAAVSLYSFIEPNCSLRNLASLCSMITRQYPFPRVPPIGTYRDGRLYRDARLEAPPSHGRRVLLYHESFCGLHLVSAVKSAALILGGREQTVYQRARELLRGWARLR